MDAEQIVRDVAERVRAIVSEAEERAAEVVRDAEQEANRIRERAEAEARERLEEVRRSLDELQGRLGRTGSEVDPGPVVVPEPEPPPVPEPAPEPVPEPTPEPSPQPEPPTIPEPTPPPDEGTPPQVAGNGAAADAGAKSEDVGAARLVAMNMALEGSSRETIEAHLADNYAVQGIGAIVDDVLARASK
jgi:outer membrane biosynthesis protein TonB